MCTALRLHARAASMPGGERQLIVLLSVVDSRLDVHRNGVEPCGSNVAKEAQ